MKTYLKISLAVFAFVTSPLYAADIAAGKSKAAACAGCHGVDGVSQSPHYPHLAGQKPAYIAAQLRAFKNKKRKNPMMEAMASNLSKEDINNLALYYASLKNTAINKTKPKEKSEAESKAGMCKGCHGNEGQGRGSFPRLANQHPEYLAKQLKAFKTKTRTGGAMPSIASSLSDQDIIELSYYFGSLSATDKK